MKEKKVVFVYDKLHPIHESLMKSITKDFFHISQRIPHKYDIYIFEGSYVRPILWRKIGKIGKKGKIISLISDPRLFYLDRKRIFDFKHKKIKRYPLLRLLLMKYFLKRLDGAFCLCETNFKLFKKFNPKAPAYQFTGFISNKIFKRLKKVNPKLNSKRILFMGHGPDYYCKGLDLLIDTFKIIKKKVPSAELYISGKWDIKKDWEHEGINFLGRRKNVIDVIKETSLGVHMGRGEAFGANIPEMMLAGVPVIVSEFTGAREVVKKFDKEFIIKMDKNILADKIIQYLDLPLKNKIVLSNKSRKAAKEYSENEIVKKFRQNAIEFIRNL